LIADGEIEGDPEYVALFPNVLLSNHAVTGELPVNPDESVASNHSLHPEITKGDGI
jgi:hypothetical protein